MRAVKILLYWGADIDEPFQQSCFADGKHFYKQSSPFKFAVDRADLAVLTIMLENFEDHAETLKRIELIDHLDLRNKGLEYLPSWFQYLPKNVKLELEGNPFSFLPVSLAKGDTTKLLAACDGRWHFPKVMVVGGAGVGKTRIVDSFRHHSNQEGPTKGIDIDTFPFVMKDVMLNLTWFDCGGNPLFHAMQAYFLSSKTIYLVVFKLNDSLSMEQAQMWLKIIQSGSKDYQVIVVGTHLDQVTKV